MGTWGPGPFDNDAAADFVDQLEAAPSRVVAKVLRRIAGTPTAERIDADAGAAAWAACEFIALAFGYGDTAAVDDNVLDSAARLAPKEEQRRLALEILSRIADPARSELAALWHEGKEGAQFDASIAHLRSRLEEASTGARPLAKAKTGDVISLPASPDSVEVIVVQVVGPGEVAVMDGAYSDDRAALESVKTKPARRIPAFVNKLLRRGRLIGSLPVRKDLKGKKLYAFETGVLRVEHTNQYVIGNANAGGARGASYEEVRDLDVLRAYEEDEIRAVALGRSPVERVCSPAEREAEWRRREAKRK